MAGKESLSVFLDTNAIIAWVGREGDSGVSAISGILNALSEKRIRAVLSQLTKLEVLECKHDDTMVRAWRMLQARPNVEVMGVTKRVIDTAYEIRNHYQSIREKDASSKKPPQQPDCLLLATAIVAGVDHFVSYDGGKRDPKHLSPLELNGMIAGQWSLSVIPPENLNISGLDV
ncbi:type II toxin-antitoxin system VapC family toxin [Sphingopyxis sp. MSC1_008]|jgi:predicted nucleic acid-binding protein|uniref:type II toxin-antitoxin system VapC family toxin n=1 Tax=Sphingopyxis sp. MSC1_008 TaxID=2909265 RepID=UPI0020C125A7|nr:PIN domain-containing protein [Sphingopyxis sp. MSC1_008]